MTKNRESIQVGRPDTLQTLLDQKKRASLSLKNDAELGAAEGGAGAAVTSDENGVDENVEVTTASSTTTERKPVTNSGLINEVQSSAIANGGGEESIGESQRFKEMKKCQSGYLAQSKERLVEVRLKNVTYCVPIKQGHAVKTVENQSVCYVVYDFFKRLVQCCQHKAHNPMSTGTPRGSWMARTVDDVFLPFAKKDILADVNLVLKPGRTYLILGPPGSGKTTLLKMIAGMLPSYDDHKDKPQKTGTVEYNGVTDKDHTGLELSNVCSFVDQLDEHAPYLTVRETFEFAFQCRTGGKHESVGAKDSTLACELNESRFTENLTIEGLDLAVCADTFVGNNDVRGVSGGQRRRVTVGEMMQGQNPVACADAISNGLDAAVTRDIVNNIVQFSKAAKTTRIISLLQPGPETFCLFDEVIVLSEGRVIYTGPIEDATAYFETLGYKQPVTMDVADFLQSIPTPDGESFLDKESDPTRSHLTSEGFAQAFEESEKFKKIMTELNGPHPHGWTDGEVPKEFTIKFQNSFWRSTVLNFMRFLTLWKRNIGEIIGKAGENFGMAAAVGLLLFGKGYETCEFDGDEFEYASCMQKNNNGLFAALFMTTFHIILGTSTSVADEVDDRFIFYKHYYSTFYQCGAFVIGRLLSTIPMRLIEIVAFAIPLYWLVGLTPTAQAFIAYIVLLVCYKIGLMMMFSILAQTLPKKANVQGVATFVMFICTLFSGFIVKPDSIPDYFMWLYWINPMHWAYQGLLSIQYSFDPTTNYILTREGFMEGTEWIGYCILYMIPYIMIFSLLLILVLKNIRIEPERALKKESKAVGEVCESSGEDFNLPFTPVDLSFENLVYEVKTSKGKDTLRLLNEVSGVFASGRMVALMGSSGAGKTTLMDVIAMRKTSGEITGEIRLNGHMQERTSFLRCSGYVEQFDVQQPQLNVRETITFCARLRLPIDNLEEKHKYVDHVLKTMELTDIQNLQIGSYEEGGLSFEQRKRVAIACELAGSPSVLFLDEPTTGLDSRGALVVMRAMKRIADTGRTVCATIHQPSAAVFEMFDDLLLLMKGGNTVFFGELGYESVNLVKYFESLGAPQIMRGENPAAWVLRAYAGEDTPKDVDFREEYKKSDPFRLLQIQIDAIKASTDDSKKISYDSIFAAPFSEQMMLMIRRIYRVYRRDPAYNLTRITIAVLYSFLLGSPFITKSYHDGMFSEQDAAGVFGTMFFALLITGITSITLAVPVMKKIRDVFYKHRASGMLEHNSVAVALVLNEIPYIIIISTIFGLIYYATTGLFRGPKNFGNFWLFFTLNMAIYSFFGQAFICLVRDIKTSMALVGALIGANFFFGGFVITPQTFSFGFTKVGFWFLPGRYAYEGLVMTQFGDVNRSVSAIRFTPYYFYLGCAESSGNATAEYLAYKDYRKTEHGAEVISNCTGTFSNYASFYFNGNRNDTESINFNWFQPNNHGLDIGILFAYLFLSIFLLWLCLWKFNYTNT